MSRIVNVSALMLVYMSSASALEISGTIRTTSGDPVSGAQVDFFAEDDTGRSFRDVTDVNGGFAVSTDPSTAVEDLADTPTGFALHQNHPNPFNPATVITYALPEAAPVRLDIFNSLGQHVRTLVDTWREAGLHSVAWDARSDVGSGTAAGVYIYRLRAGGLVASHKMVLLDGAAQRTRGIEATPVRTAAKATAASTYRVNISAPGIVTYAQVRLPLVDGGRIDFTVKRTDSGLRGPFAVMTYAGTGSASGSLADLPRQLQIPWRNLSAPRCSTSRQVVTLICGGR